MYPLLNVARQRVAVSDADEQKRGRCPCYHLELSNSAPDCCAWMHAGARRVQIIRYIALMTERAAEAAHRILTLRS